MAPQVAEVQPSSARVDAAPAAKVHAVPRIAIIADFVEEGWRSMDLVADMLAERLAAEHARSVAPALLRPHFTRLFTAIPIVSKTWFGSTADRVLNRFISYPRRLRARRGAFDLFHIVDHSYSHLVHQLPADRTIVTCHDLDAFRCVLEPAAELRSAVFRALARWSLDGLRKAAMVSCPSAATRDAIVAHALLPPERLVVIPNAAHAACAPAPEPASDAAAAAMLGAVDANAPEILHVGSTIARKRIDVLLRIFSGLQRIVPRARLVRVGGPFMPEQARLARALGIDGSIVVLPALEYAVLAAVYRRAALTVLPSDAEGFGLPVIESMACGTPVVASDLAALREAGGGAAVYCPSGDADAWIATVAALLDERAARPDAWAARRRAAIAHASAFTWNAYAAKTASLYRSLLNGAAGLSGAASR